MRSAVPILLWGLAAIGGLVVLGLVAWWTRRWLFGEDASGGGPVFTLQDLREMRDRGALSDAEYEHMRAEILAAYGAGAPRANDAAEADSAE